MTAAGARGGHRPVAIVGIGCRFPGGIGDARAYWRYLSEGRDAIAEIPPDRIEIAYYFDERPATPGRIMTRWGGYLEGLRDLDAGFFNLSPREAERLDPQHRLLLELAWEALEDAGQDAAALEESRTGVFVGQWLQDFEGRLFADPEAVDFFMTTGSGRYAGCGRISYLLGLRGPSLSIDSACSSSLAAVHLAVQSIRNGECELAFAGGVNVIMQPHISIAYSQSRMMAPDGRCKFADASGDGYVRSEGAGLVLLKALDRAVADGDRIYALIHGSAINNDGRSSGSMGTPSRAGQEALLRTAYADAGVDPAAVGYVEAHGTGTRAGDPVELGALGAVLARDRSDAQRCRVGSVKTNIGHTEGAAGVAGLIKAALAVHHGAIPPSLHCRVPNPAVPWAELPLEVPRTLQEWPVPGGERFAGVSAFGIAGTNAHVVLGAAPAPEKGAAPRQAPAAGEATAAILPLSARTLPALRALAGRYAALLLESDAPSLPAVCWNAATRRTALESRAAFVAAGRAEMIDVLQRVSAGEEPALHGLARPAEAPRIAFVVPGQGAQWVGMGRRLAQEEPAFKLALQRCDDAAREFVSWSIEEQLFLDPASPGYLLDRIDVIQPVLVAMAIAYAALWESRGVRPHAIVGHSMGEVGAACIAGVLSVPQAMRIVCRRSALMRSVAGAGAMALVELPLQELRRRLAGAEDRISAAVSNSPRSSVASGDPRSVQALMRELEQEQVFCRLVNVDVASHSPQMQPLAEQLERELRDLRPAQAAIPIYSTVMGRQVDGGTFDAGYWARNLRQTVLFEDAIGALLTDGFTAFIELGPHPVLLPSVQQTAGSRGRETLNIASGHRDRSDQEMLLAGIGGLWTRGSAVDWRTAMEPAAGFVALPSYPWQRERHWLDAADRAEGRRLRDYGAAGGAGAHPLFGPAVAVGGDLPGSLWDLDLNLARLPHLAAHRLHNAPVLAASVYVELAVAASRALGGGGRVQIESLAFERAVHLERDAASRLRLQALPADGSMTFAWLSEVDGRWIRHASARLARPGVSGVTDMGADMGADGSPLPSLHDDPADPATGSEAGVAASDFYARLQCRGVVFGQALRAIDRVRRLGDCVVADLTDRDSQCASEPVGGAGHAVAEGRTNDAQVACNGPGHDRFAVPPAALDACFQLAASLAPEGALWIPCMIDQVECSPDMGSPRQVIARERPRGSDAALVIDVELRGSRGPLLKLAGLRLEQLGGHVTGDVRHWLFRQTWKPEDRLPAPPARQRRWLLVAEDEVLSREVAALLQRAGMPVAVVPAGEVACAAGESMLGAALREDRQQLVEVLYLPGVADPPAEPSSASIAALERAVRLIQLLDRFDAAPRRCWFVTRGARAVGAGDGQRLSLAQAPLWGLGAAVAVEHPSLWGGCIDLDPQMSAGDSAACVVAEVGAGGAAAVAFRAGQRYSPGLDEAGGAGEASPVCFRTDATYLVTGGLGGIGLQVAKWMISRGARRLAILGRTQPPARALWGAMDERSPGYALVRGVQMLEGLGASVHYAAVDLADAGRLEAFLQSFRAEGWPAIRGVFHAAGAIDDRLIGDLEPSQLRAVMAGKAVGAWQLHRLLPRLDIFVLFSSVASLLPQPGQASYAAANAFLDALAHARRADGQAAHSINWAVWDGVGFAATTGGAEAKRQLQGIGIEPLAPGKGTAALEAVIARADAQIAVLPLDRGRLRDALAACDRGSRTLLAPLGETRPALAAAEGEADAAAVESFATLLSRQDPARRNRLLQERLAGHAAAVLKLGAGRLDPRSPLGSYGLNSLMAMELRNRLEIDLDLPISATALWNYPSVAALAEHLLGRLAPASPPTPSPVAGDDPGVMPDEDPAALEVEALSDDEALAALLEGAGAGRGRA